MDTVFPMLFATYTELEQLHMQVLLNSHLAAFCTVYSNSKKWLNDSLITLACVIAVVRYS